MSYEIHRSVVSTARVCPRDNACLEGEEHLHCHVSDLLRGSEEEFVLLECCGMRDCVYCQSFYLTRICTCPVRKEIFKIYGR